MLGVGWGCVQAGQLDVRKVAGCGEAVCGDSGDVCLGVLEL